MPKARIRDIEIYYDVHGAGFPLVLIRGLGSNADHWYAQTPFFSSHFSLVCFDNRGIGRSQKTDGPYTISMMAEDTVALMDAIGISRAHVLGLSMGGMIAQRVALAYPQKVSGLVLACTHCGGDDAVRPPEEIAKIFVEYILTGSQEAAQQAATCIFTEETLKNRPEVIQQYQEVSQRFIQEPAVLIAQWKAVQGHDTWTELPNIKSPTLVLTGSEDILVPPENATTLAERIPNAQLKVIEGGGHQFLVEQADAFNEAVLDFLESLSEQPASLEA
jgi:pimeloyl-ACP methyl ester carboxylesterase